jgi:hypothetical protein
VRQPVVINAVPIDTGPFNECCLLAEPEPGAECALDDPAAMLINRGWITPRGARKRSSVQRRQSSAFALWARIGCPWRSLSTPAEITVLPST